MAVWPGTLPTLEIVGAFSFTLADDTVRTEMDVGPPKVRRRAASRPVPVRMGHPALTAVQAATFVTFYRDTLAGGSLAFDMADPRPGATGNASLRFSAPPTITPAAPAVWGVSCDLEILP